MRGLVCGLPNAACKVSCNPVLSESVFFLIYFIALFSVIWIHVRDYKIINSLLFRTTRYNKLYGAVLLNPGSNYNLYS